MTFLSISNADTNISVVASDLSIFTATLESLRHHIMNPASQDLRLDEHLKGFARLDLNPESIDPKNVPTLYQPHLRLIHANLHDLNAVLTGDHLDANRAYLNELHTHCLDLQRLFDPFAGMDEELAALRSSHDADTQAARLAEKAANGLKQSIEGGDIEQVARFFSPEFSELRAVMLRPGVVKILWPTIVSPEGKEVLRRVGLPRGVVGTRGVDVVAQFVGDLSKADGRSRTFVKLKENPLHEDLVHSLAADFKGSEDLLNELLAALREVAADQSHSLSLDPNLFGDLGTIGSKLRAAHADPATRARYTKLAKDLGEVADTLVAHPKFKDAVRSLELLRAVRDLYLSGDNTSENSVARS